MDQKQCKFTCKDKANRASNNSQLENNKSRDQDDKLNSTKQNWQVPDHWWDFLLENSQVGYYGILRKYIDLVQLINSFESEIQQLTDEQLKGKKDEFQQRYTQGKESVDQLLPEVFAVVREVSRRVLNLRHYDCQLLGGIILFYGDIAELATGEGKTLVATLPTCLNAITGKQTHICTVNDYLVQRDSQWMGSIYKFLGLSFNYVTQYMPHNLKQQSYQADIVYLTASTMVFDYQQDRQNLDQQSRYMQRTFDYAVIDEVDSLLIDACQNPLIISQMDNQSLDQVLVKQATEIANSLEFNVDFKVDQFIHKVTYTEEGLYNLAGQLESRGIIELPPYKEIDDVVVDLFEQQPCWGDLVQRSLKAKYLYILNVDYLIRNEMDQNKMVLIDKATGRLLETTKLALGLNSFIEAHHNLEIQQEGREISSMTYQNFFRNKFAKISGMTGTARSDEQEFQSVYKLKVFPVPTNRPMIRKDFPPYIVQSSHYKILEICYHIYSETFRTFWYDVPVQNLRQDFSQNKTSGNGYDSVSAHPQDYNWNIIDQENQNQMQVDNIQPNEMKPNQVYQKVKRLKMRPILIATASVEESEFLHKQLIEFLDKNNESFLVYEKTGSDDEGDYAYHGIKPEEVDKAYVNTYIPRILLLNTRPEMQKLEAQMISQAGMSGTVLITTQMAGRGTDIKLGGDVKTLTNSYVQAALKSIKKFYFDSQVDVQDNTQSSEENINLSLGTISKNSQGREGDVNHNQIQSKIIDNVIQQHLKKNLNGQQHEQLSTENTSSRENNVAKDSQNGDYYSNQQSQNSSQDINLDNQKDYEQQLSQIISNTSQQLQQQQFQQQQQQQQQEQYQQQQFEGNSGNYIEVEVPKYLQSVLPQQSEQLCRQFLDSLTQQDTWSFINLFLEYVSTLDRSIFKNMLLINPRECQLKFIEQFSRPNSKFLDDQNLFNGFANHDTFYEYFTEDLIDITEIYIMRIQRVGAHKAREEFIYNNPSGLIQKLVNFIKDQWLQQSEKCKNDADLVIQSGGLLVIGTNVFQNQRVELQLRGRSGRQGDPGESWMYFDVDDQQLLHPSVQLTLQGLNKISQREYLCEPMPGLWHKQFDISNSNSRQMREELLTRDEVDERYRDYWNNLTDMMVSNGPEFRLKFIFNLIYKAVKQIVVANIDGNQPCTNFDSWNYKRLFQDFDTFVNGGFEIAQQEEYDRKINVKGWPEMPLGENLNINQPLNQDQRALTPVNSFENVKKIQKYVQDTDDSFNKLNNMWLENNQQLSFEEKGVVYDLLKEHLPSSTLQDLDTSVASQYSPQSVNLEPIGKYKNQVKELQNYLFGNGCAAYIHVKRTRQILQRRFNLYPGQDRLVTDEIEFYEICNLILQYWQNLQRDLKEEWEGNQIRTHKEMDPKSEYALNSTIMFQRYLSEFELQVPINLFQSMYKGKAISQSSQEREQMEALKRYHERINLEKQNLQLQLEREKDQSNMAESTLEKDQLRNKDTQQLLQNQQLDLQDYKNSIDQEIKLYTPELDNELSNLNRNNNRNNRNQSQKSRIYQNENFNIHDEEDQDVVDQQSSNISQANKQQIENTQQVESCSENLNVDVPNSLRNVQNKQNQEGKNKKKWPEEMLF